LYRETAGAQFNDGKLGVQSRSCFARDRDPSFTRAPMLTGTPNKARGRSEMARDDFERCSEMARDDDETFRDYPREFEVLRDGPR
jgi:hypothetical protein